jgi:propionate CoA-transferase
VRSCGHGQSFTLAEHGVEKVIARRAAMELKRGMTANLGFGISAMVPRILLEEGHAQAVTWAIEQGAVGGMPLTGFAFGCASNADAFVPSPNQFTYFQGGGFDMSFLSFLEVDVEGNVNVSKLGKKPYLTAGAAASWTSRRMRRRSCSRGISRRARSWT